MPKNREKKKIHKSDPGLNDNAKLSVGNMMIRKPLVADENASQINEMTFAPSIRPPK